MTGFLQQLCTRTRAPVYCTTAQHFTADLADRLTEQFSEYEVQEGGSGAGTLVHWKLQATEKRIRDILFAVTEPTAGQLVETDRNSSMVTSWTVTPAGEGRAKVVTSTTWTGAGGVKGFFEKTFAPLGLKKIQGEVLTNLKNELESQPG